MKKGNIVAFSIFLFVLLAVFIKYLVIKFEARKYKTLWEENQQFIEEISKPCFFVEKAHYIDTNNEKKLIIKLPTKYVLNGFPHNNNFFILDGIYYTKVVNKVYLEGKELMSTDFLIISSEICVK